MWSNDRIDREIEQAIATVDARLNGGRLPVAQLRELLRRQRDEGKQEVHRAWDEAIKWHKEMEEEERVEREREELFSEQQA